MLKPGARGLLKAVKRAPKTAYHAIRDRVPRGWLHINLLTQLTIEEGIVNIKLRHRPVANGGHRKKSANSGHMSHGGESLIIITTLLLLEATSHKTSFLMLKRTIRAGLNLIDPLAHDETNMGWRRNQIPCASAFKHSNLLSHRKLPLEVNDSILIRSRLKDNRRKTIVVRRISVRWGRGRARRS